LQKSLETNRTSNTCHYETNKHALGFYIAYRQLSVDSIGPLSTCCETQRRHRQPIGRMKKEIMHVISLALSYFRSLTLLISISCDRDVVIEMLEILATTFFNAALARHRDIETLRYVKLARHSINTKKIITVPVALFIVL